jgi:HlyD family secretion protein
VVAETLAKAVMLAERVTLVAPEDGVVLAVARRSAGSVLNPAEALVTLTPTGAELIAEVMIGSADIGYLLPGQRAALKIDAFPFQRHGTLPGQLRSVGAESLAPGGDGALPASGQPIPGAFHRSQVVLDTAALRKLPDRAALLPGMTLTAEIQVGARSVLSYFLYPILRGFDEALREP